MRHKRVRRELYGWSCAACAVRCGVPERARGGAWPPEAGRLAPARPAPACVPGLRAAACAAAHPRPVPVCAPRAAPAACRSRPRVGVRAAACAGSCAGRHVPGLCGGWHVPGLWAGPRGGLCLPACTSRPAGGSRAGACAGLCAGVCTPGWWAGCSPRPGAGVAGPGCGPARGSACAAVAAFVPGLWAGCGGLRRPCGPCACRGLRAVSVGLVVRLVAGLPPPGGRLPRRFVCRVPGRSVCSPSCRPRGRVCRVRVRVSGFRRCVCGC